MLITRKKENVFRMLKKKEKLLLSFNNRIKQNEMKVQVEKVRIKKMLKVKINGGNLTQ